MNIIEHLPEILTGITGLIGTLFFKQKADKRSEALRLIKEESDFVSKQQKELYEVYDQMIELKQVQVELINSNSLLERKYKLLLLEN